MRCAAAWVLLGVVLAACSGSSGGGGDGGSTGDGGACDPSVGACTGSCTGCGLLTPAQVSKAFGLTVGKGKNQNGNCEWDSTTGDSFDGYDLVLDVGGGVQDFENVCHPEGSKAVPGVTEVSGVGDGACSFGGGSLARPILTVLRGCSSYSFNVNTAGTFQAKLTDAQVEAAEKELALEVLANL